MDEYLYYEQLNNAVYAINLITPSFPSEVGRVRKYDGGFWFQDKKYSTLSDFLNYLHGYNISVLQKYNRNYAITAPFCTYQYCSERDNIVYTMLIAHGSIFNFICDVPVDKSVLNDTAFNVSYLKPGCCFDINVLMKLVFSILYNRVIWPDNSSMLNEDKYIVKFDQTRLNAQIIKTPNGYNLFMSGRPISQVLKLYGITKQTLEDELKCHFCFNCGIFTEHKKDIIRLIDFINNRCYSTVVKPNTTIYDEIEMVQSKFGKWFVRGKRKDLSYIFGDMKKVREIARSGGKKITGVFPECDTKKELEELIKRIIDEI